MLYEINYKMYAFLFLSLVWVIVWPTLMVYDLFKGNEFSPWYRLSWPFVIIAELFC